MWCDANIMPCYPRLFCGSSFMGRSDAMKGRKKKQTRDQRYQIRYELGEKIVTAAGMEQKDLLDMLLRDDWKQWFTRRAASRSADWQNLSIRFCTALARPATENTIDAVNIVLCYVRSNCSTLISTLEGHRLVEASLRGHTEVVAKSVSDAILSDPGLLTQNIYVGRVCSCLLRNTINFEEGGTCSKAVAARADMLWESQTATAIYVLMALVACGHDSASTVARLWFRPDALSKLVARRRCTMDLLLCCLRCRCLPERRELVAMFIVALEMSYEVSYIMMKAFVRTKPSGIQILCQLAQLSSSQLGVRFADYLVSFFEQLDRTLPSSTSMNNQKFPSLDCVQRWLMQERAQGPPKALPYATELAKNGASAVGLYCRLLQAKDEQEMSEEISDEHLQLWPPTPDWFTTSPAEDYSGARTI